jgi:hypothetical protein
VKNQVTLTAKEANTILAMHVADKNQDLNQFEFLIVNWNFSTDPVTVTISGENEI